VIPGAPLPGPPGLLPHRPDAVVDLRTTHGAALVGGVWRYRDADLVAIDSPSVGPDLVPSGPPVRTLDVAPHAEGADHDDSGWEVLAPPAVEARRGRGRVCAAWYRIAVTLPERVGGFAVAGSTVVFEVVVDDYAEVWVDGRLPTAPGQVGGGVVGGFNVPNRVVVASDAVPGRRIVLAVFAMNGPVSASPRNALWIRSATLDLYRAGRARVARDVPAAVTRTGPAVDTLLPPGAVAEQVAEGFDAIAGLVVAPDGAVLVSAGGAHAVHRWTPDGQIGVARAKGGAAGLALDAAGRLTVCEPDAGRVVRVEPHGNLTILASDLDAPRHLAHGAGGVLWIGGRGLHRVDAAAPAAAAAGAGTGADAPWQPVGPFAPTVRVAAEPGDVAALAADPGGGALHAAEGDRVLRFAVDGAGRLGDPETAWREDGSVTALLAAGDAVAVGVPSGVRLRAPHGAELGAVRLPAPAVALARGGGALFAATDTALYRIGPRPGA